MESDSHGEDVYTVEYCCCCSSPLNELKEKSEKEEDSVKVENIAKSKSADKPCDSGDPNQDPDAEANTKSKETEKNKGSSPIPTVALADIHILATIFEYPYIIREENTVFETETEEFGICNNCRSILDQLFPMYITFTELLQPEGKIWRTLQKIGKEPEPILPILVYDDSHDEDDNQDDDYAEEQTLKSRGYNFSHTATAKTRRPRKLPPKRFSSRVIASDSDQDYHPSADSVAAPKKPKKAQNSGKKKSPGSGAKRGRKPRQKKRVSSEDISDDEQNFGDSNNDDVVLIENSEDDRSSIDSGSDLDFEIRTSRAELPHPDPNPDQDPDNVSNPILSTSKLESNSNITNEGDEEGSINPGTRKLRGRSIKLTDSPLVENRTKKFQAFVEGVLHKAKVKASAKAKAKKRSTNKKDNQIGPKPKKPRIRKPDTRKRIRIRKSRKECWSEVKKGDPTRTCDVCGKLFLFPRLMNHHKITVHEGQKPYECKACGKGFTQKFILKKHLCDYSQLPENERDFLILEREAKLRLFLCDVCGKKFKGKAQLVLHKQNHRDDRPHKCDKCTKTFRRHDHLKKHIKAVHTDGQRHVCSICGQTFKIPSSLRAHEKRHNSPKETHVCTICGKSFDSILVVRRHQMTHDETLPFQCEVCGKRFKMKDYLGQHLRKGKSCKPGMPRREPSQSQSQKQNQNQSQNQDQDHSSGRNSNVYMENMSSLSVGSSASTASAGVSNDNFGHEMQRAPGPSLGHIPGVISGPGPSLGHSGSGLGPGLGVGHGSGTGHGPGAPGGHGHLTHMMEFPFGHLFDRSSMTEL